MRTNGGNSLGFWIIPLLIYGIPNLVLFWLSQSYDVIVVDMVPVSRSLSQSESYFALGILALSFMLLIFVSQRGSRFFFVKQKNLQAPSLLGKIIFALQLGFFFVVVALDYGRVGGGASSSPFAVIFSYLHVDAIFLIYYGHCRGHKIPYANLLLFLLSNAIRGWSGIWLILFLIETYYAVQRMPMKKFLSYVAIACLLLLTAYPPINSYKDTVRGTEQTEETTFLGSMARLIVRLQQITSTLLIAQESKEIEMALDRNEIIRFYSDNTLGSKLFGYQENAISLQKYLSVNFLIDMEKFRDQADLDEMGWYVHTGIAGWMFIINWHVVPIYLIFLVFLILLPYWISAKLISNPSVIPILHVAGIVYVFHGWFSVQIGFIVGMLWYAMLLQTIISIARAQKSQLTPDLEKR